MKNEELWYSHNCCQIVKLFALYSTYSFLPQERGGDIDDLDLAEAERERVDDHAHERE